MIGMKDPWKQVIDKITGLRKKRQELETEASLREAEQQATLTEEERALREARELELRKALEMLEAHKAKVFPPLVKAQEEAVARFDGAMAELRKCADALWDAHEAFAQEAAAFAHARSQVGLTEQDLASPHLPGFHRREGWSPFSVGAPPRREWDGGLGSLVTARLRRLRYLAEEANNGKRG